MSRHHDALVSFDVPRDWSDRTVVAYAAPPREGERHAPNVVVTRDDLPEEEGLEEYVDRQLDALADRLRGFVLDGREDGELGGRPAVVISFGSTGAHGPLAQRLTIVALPDRKVVSFTMTAPERDAAQLTPLFDRIASSVSFDESTKGGA
jgi:hypothetical protein